MKRVTEPELMIFPDQVRAYAEADFSSTEEQIITSLKRLLKKNHIVLGEETLIIDLGCGPGNISEKLSYCWPTSNVIGIDGSSEMIKFARKRHANRANKRSLERLSYKKINMLELAMEDSLFLKSADIVVSNSLLHHIHDPSIFFKTLVNISKEGAFHFHRDLRRPLSSEEVFHLQQKHLPKAPNVLIKDFKASLHAAFTLKEVENEILFAGINGFNVVEIDDRYIDINGYIL